MIKIVKQLAYEPLLHFVLLGVLIYAYFSFTQKVVSNKNIILVSSDEVNQLKSLYEKNYEREANDETLKILIAKKYYDKVLLDKAHSIKLAHNDDIIMQRLLQKMQFVMLDSSKYKEPTQKELYTYYTQHIKEYAYVETISFSSVYFRNDKDKRVEPTLNLLRIAKVNSMNARVFSDISALPYHVENVSYDEIRESYGKYFADKLFRLKKGVWHKAIQSKDGIRLVYIDAKKTSTPYGFDVVEDRVYTDYMQEQLKIQKESAYREIASQYTLKLE